MCKYADVLRARTGIRVMHLFVCLFVNALFVCRSLLLYSGPALPCVVLRAREHLIRLETERDCFLFLFPARHGFLFMCALQWDLEP